MSRVGALPRVAFFMLFVLATSCGLAIRPPIFANLPIRDIVTPTSTVATARAETKVHSPETRFITQVSETRPTTSPTATPTPKRIVTQVIVSTPTPTATATMQVNEPDPVVDDLTGRFLETFDTPIENNRVPVEEPIRIEVANQSGVSGYAVSAFGGGFGTQPSSVTVLGQPAEILEWDFDYVRVVVPEVADGAGELVISNANGGRAVAPFTVYTIDPQFLAPPTTDYKNVLRGKRAVVQGVERSFCNDQPTNQPVKPEQFLTDFQCGFDGFVANGGATFSADSESGNVAIVAANMEEALAGDYIFQFESDTHWHVRKQEASSLNSLPFNYEVQISANSTNGTDGDWVSIASVRENRRGSRSHPFFVSAEDNVRWIRLYVTDGLKDHSEPAGRDFTLREVRLFSTQGELPYSFGLYGDSLTYAAFELMGRYSFAEQVRSFTERDVDLFTTFFGLVGQDSEGLLNSDTDDSDIYDALWLDQNIETIRYWGIAIGTNDSRDDAATIWQAGTNLGDYGTRLDNIVRYLISAERVPILARIPDTNVSIGGFGTIKTKSHILSQIDAVQARHRLIPGPDLYTIFRRHVDLGDSSWFGYDGTHHANRGKLVLNRLWAEAFVTAIQFE